MTNIKRITINGTLIATEILALCCISYTFLLGTMLTLWTMEKTIIRNMIVTDEIAIILRVFGITAVITTGAIMINLLIKIMQKTEKWRIQK